MRKKTAVCARCKHVDSWEDMEISEVLCAQAVVRAVVHVEFCARRNSQILNQIPGFQYLCTKSILSAHMCTNQGLCTYELLICAETIKWGGDCSPPHPPWLAMLQMAYCQRTNDDERHKYSYGGAIASLLFLHGFCPLSGHGHL